MPVEFSRRIALQLKETFSYWTEDKATKLAAALAFYTMLSIAPLLTITVKTVSVIFDEEKTIAVVNRFLSETAGKRGAEAAEQMMISASQAGSGVIATIISVLVLIASASGVFGELQDSLNTIWKVKPRPGRGFLDTIKDRFFSMTLVFGVAFLLIVSLVISAALAAFATYFGGSESMIWNVINLLVSLVILSGLFALIFRYIPDVRTPWKSVAIGGTLTALFFTLGKFLLGWYLGRATTTSVYGAAGSLVALLLWVYYSAQILFFGAEFTRVVAKSNGEEMNMLNSAMPITEGEASDGRKTNSA